MGLISVEILSENCIRENMRAGCSFGIASVKRRRHRIAKCNSVISTLKVLSNLSDLKSRSVPGVSRCTTAASGFANVRHEVLSRCKT